VETGDQLQTGLCVCYQPITEVLDWQHDCYEIHRRYRRGGVCQKMCGSVSAADAKAILFISPGLAQT
jgi:hypothetical protein